MNKAEKFYSDCGEIILLATSIEYTLGKELTLHLLYGKRPTSFLYGEDQFAEERFESKIKLLEKLCKTRKIELKLKKRLLDSLKQMQTTRNKVAHWGMEYDFTNDKFHLKHRTKQKKFDAGSEVNNMRKNYSIAFAALIELSNEIHVFSE